MRLIDYDALEQYAVEYQERHKGDELTRGEFKLIDNFMFECPKTEAIPVEWMGKFCADDIAEDQRETIAWMLGVWQKEQDAKT